MHDIREVRVHIDAPKPPPPPTFNTFKKIQESHGWSFKFGNWWYVLYTLVDDKMNKADV